MPQDTYYPTSDNRTATEMVYDPVTKQWVIKSATNSTGLSIDTTSQTSTIVPTSDPMSGVARKVAADKEFIDIEFNTLTGDLNLLATKKSIKVVINDTIKIEGLGKYLSGLYFVSSIKRTIDSSSGYSQSFSLTKTGFGNTLKTYTIAPPTPPAGGTPDDGRDTEIPKDTSPYKVGDKIKIIASDAVYSNYHDGVRVPNWVKELTHTVDAVSADQKRVRLKEIWSWTYIKYIQRV